MARRRSRLSTYQQFKLVEHFVAGTPARTAAELAPVNRNTAILFYRKLREIIAARIEDDSRLSGEIEADESYFGGVRKGKPYASIGTNLLFFEKGQPTKDIWFWERRVSEGQKAYFMTKPIRLDHLKDCIDWWGGAKRKDREEGPEPGK